MCATETDFYAKLNSHFCTNDRLPIIVDLFHTYISHLFSSMRPEFCSTRQFQLQKIRREGFGPTDRTLVHGGSLLTKKRSDDHRKSTHGVIYSDIP